MADVLPPEAVGRALQFQATILQEASRLVELRSTQLAFPIQQP